MEGWERKREGKLLSEIGEQERRNIRQKERETERRDGQTDFFIIIIRLPPEFLPAPGLFEW